MFFATHPIKITFHLIRSMYTGGLIVRHSNKFHVLGSSESILNWWGQVYHTIDDQTVI